MGCVARSSLHPGIGGAATAHARPAYATATAHTTDATAHAAAAAASAQHQQAKPGERARRIGCLLALAPRLRLPVAQDRR